MGVRGWGGHFCFVSKQLTILALLPLQHHMFPKMSFHPSDTTPLTAKAICMHRCVSVDYVLGKRT